MIWHLKVRAMFGTAKWATLRAWRRAELRRLCPNGKVSPHFRYIEFATKDGTPIPVLALPGLRRLCHAVLEPLREIYGPAYISSGYRHYHYNASIGGASDSRHVWDKRPAEPATDVIFARGTPEQWAQTAAGLMRKNGVGGGIGTYRVLGFVHLDQRRAADRWSGSGD